MGGRAASAPQMRTGTSARTTVAEAYRGTQSCGTAAVEEEAPFHSWANGQGVAIGNSAKSRAICAAVDPKTPVRQRTPCRRTASDTAVVPHSGKRRTHGAASTMPTATAVSQGWTQQRTTQKLTPSYVSERSTSPSAVFPGAAPGKPSSSRKQHPPWLHVSSETRR